MTRITVWMCDECGYWRQEKSTGVHMAPHPETPSGPLTQHRLRQAEFVDVAELDEARAERDFLITHVEQLQSRITELEKK